MNVKIRIKLFATLRQGLFEEQIKEYARGTTVAKVIEALNIPDEKVKIIFVNSTQATSDQELCDGDTLALFPPIGGG